MRSSARGGCITVLSLVVCSGGASAADSDGGLRCAAIGEDAARLACYDAVFRVPSAATQATDTAAAAVATQATGTSASPAGKVVQAPPVVEAAAAAPVSSPAQDFGLTPARKESIEAAEAKVAGAPATPREPKVPDSITVKVATVAHRLRGELVVITEDGQVWMQIDTETKGRVNEGDDVVIRKGTLGSYLLVTPNHILVRVRRVK